MSLLIGDYYQEKAIMLKEAKSLFSIADTENNSVEMIRQLNRIEYLTFLVSKTVASKIRSIPSSAIEPIQVVKTIEVSPTLVAPTVVSPTVVAQTVTTKPKSSHTSFFSKFFA